MCGLHQLLLFFTDYCSSGGDVKEGARAGGGTEEVGSDPTAAVQIPAERTEGGRGLTKAAGEEADVQMTASPERETMRMYCRPLGSDITEDYIQHLKQAYLLTKTSACAL